MVEGENYVRPDVLTLSRGCLKQAGIQLRENNPFDLEKSATLGHCVHCSVLFRGLPAFLVNKHDPCY